MNQINEPKTNWGGNWTEIKLDTFENYVKAYLTIMNAQKKNMIAGQQRFILTVLQVAEKELKQKKNRFFSR